MKIAFVVSRFPTLSESFIVQQIVGLLKKNYNVKILSFSQPKQTEIQKEVVDYNLIQKTTYFMLPKKKWQLRLKGFLYICICFYYSPKAIYHLLKTFKNTFFSYQDLFLAQYMLKNKIDLIHAHFGPNGNHSLAIKKAKLNTRLITTFHGYDITVSICQQGRHIYDRLFADGDLFTYNSEATKQKLTSLGCPENKMFKLPMAIDFDKYSFKARSLKSSEKIRLLSVGRLVEMKGREYAIKAIGKLKDKYPIQYDIIGDGPLKEDLEKLICYLHLEQTVRLHGWVSSDQLNLFYNDAHLFIHPSVISSNGNSEGQGVVLLEAQACGIPVVATLHGAFPDSVIDGQTGFLVQERDADKLAAVIDKLIQKADSWPKIGTKGREFVQNNFDSIILNQKMEQIYKLALDSQ